MFPPEKDCGSCPVAIRGDKNAIKCDPCTYLGTSKVRWTEDEDEKKKPKTTVPPTPTRKKPLEHAPNCFNCRHSIQGDQYEVKAQRTYCAMCFKEMMN